MMLRFKIDAKFLKKRRIKNSEENFNIDSKKRNKNTVKNLNLY